MEAVIQPGMRTVVPGAPEGPIVDRTVPYMVPPSPAAAPDAPAAVQSQQVDPHFALLVKAVDTLGAVARQPGNRGPVVAGILAGLIAGLLGGVGTVWIHDLKTSGSITTRLDEQDKTQATIADAQLAMAKRLDDQETRGDVMIELVRGLLDEQEDFGDYLPDALTEGFAGRPIPRRRSGVPRLRSKLPAR